MWFARPAVSAVDQDCSSNDMRRVCDHGRLYQQQKQNLQLEVARLQNLARPYHDWNQCIRAEWYALNATFGVHVAQGCHSVLPAASVKFGLKLA
jgi:N-formylglutamate amidohydrolase